MMEVCKISIQIHVHRVFLFSSLWGSLICFRREAAATKGMPEACPAPPQTGEHEYSTGFSLKRVRVVLRHPDVPIFSLMWLFLIKKSQIYFDLSTTTMRAGEPYINGDHYLILIIVRTILNVCVCCDLM